MKILIRHIIPCFLLVVLGCQIKENGSKNSIEVSNGGNTAQSANQLQDFFYNFPNSFDSFQSTYGYDDTKGAAPKYEFYEKHISLFYDASTVINEKTFSEKLIEISKNGKWDADGVGLFQEKLRAYFFDHSKQFLELLNHKDTNEIIGFWYFFSDGPHFNDEVHDKVIKVLEGNSNMKSSYLKAVQQVKEDNIH